jgi:hypothetical protein
MLTLLILVGIAVVTLWVGMKYDLYEDDGVHTGFGFPKQRKKSKTGA